MEISPTPKDATLSGEMVPIAADWSLADGSGSSEVGRRYAELFGLTAGDGAPGVRLARDPAMAGEEYRLSVGSDGVTVSAATARGFHHALATLVQIKDGPRLFFAEIHDWPRLAVRGIHIMSDRTTQMTMEFLQRLIDSAARLKLNTLMWEFGNRFPLEGEHARINSPNALSRDELGRLFEQTRDAGIENIPCLQSLGHMQYILSNDAYADVRERTAAGPHYCMCPSNPRSFEIWTQLAEQYLEVFEGCTTMHIGGDEAFQLGECPACHERMRSRHGDALQHLEQDFHALKDSPSMLRAWLGERAFLYIEHINKICEWLAERGITPIIWDDLLAMWPPMLDELHESAVIHYWDYWSVNSPSPLLVVCRTLTGILYDERWQDPWLNELPGIVARIMMEHAAPVRLEEALDEDYLQAYEDYLGDQFPKFVPAFPYLEYYQDKGRKVIGGPAGSSGGGLWYDITNFPRHGENIKTVADRCIEGGAEGMITTMWRNRVPEIWYYALLTTSQFAW